MSARPSLLKSCKSKRGDKLRVYWCSLCLGYHITRRERGRPT